MPRKLMENMREKGVVPHLMQSAQRFKRKGNKKPKLKAESLLRTRAL